MYEPRIGDLVIVDGCHVAEVTQLPTVSGPLVAFQRSPHSAVWLVPEPRPLRPDAPGQRVRAEGWGVGKYQSGVTVDPATRPDGRPGFIVRWDDPAEFSYKTSPWTTANLIRIANQAPADPVEAPRPAAMYAALVAPGPALLDAAAAQWASPEYAPTGPTCQHCGSGVVAGLLRDTCPRGCDLTLRAAEPEPSVVQAMWTSPDGLDTESCDTPCPPGWERRWLAGGMLPDGRHAVAEHPTREGAIVAWREAVAKREGGGG